jgi:hypothetical protein
MDYAMSAERGDYPHPGEWRAADPLPARSLNHMKSLSVLTAFSHDNLQKLDDS